MTFKIRNVSGGSVDIDDLGLTLGVASEYDLRQDQTNQVYVSDDLRNAINIGDIVLLDPLGGSPHPVLSTAEALRALDVTSVPNYRIFGGELDQLDDVKIGSPASGDVLTYNGTIWQPQQSGSAFTRTAVSSNYTVLSTDRFIGLDTTGGSPITLTLPVSTSVSLGQIVTIKDETSNARRRNVTINTAGSPADTIEGGETTIIVAINDFSLDLQWTGFEWSIV